MNAIPTATPDGGDGGIGRGPEATGSGDPPTGWQPPALPTHRRLTGTHVVAEPLRAEDHAQALADAARAAQGDGADAGPPWPGSGKAGVLAWLDTLEAEAQARYLVLRARADGRIAGLAGLTAIAPPAGTLELGGIWIAPQFRRSVAATEGLGLCIARAFALGYRRVGWCCDPSDQAALRAGLRLGFSFEALYRDGEITHDRAVDVAVLGLTDRDWPAVAAAHARWLVRENFEPDGRQRMALSALTAPLLRALPPRTPPETPPEAGVPPQSADADPAATDASRLPGGPGHSPPVPTRPARPPVRASLTGRHVRLEPLSVDHAPALHRANLSSSDGAIWRWLPYGPFDDLDAYGDWVGRMTLTADPLFFAVVVDDEPLGVLSFLRIAPGLRRIELGHICLSPHLQRTPAATEAMVLTMRWAFGEGYRRFEWKCDANNGPSRRAAQRLGLSFEGITRQAGVVRGRNRDTAWYAATAAEWPAMAAAFDRWLAPANFDTEGRQKQRLSELTAPLLRRRG